MDGVEVSVMVWSSTTVDSSHIDPSLVCVRGSRVCIKACELLQVSESFGVEMFCQLRALCKVLGKKKWLWG